MYRNPANSAFQQKFELGLMLSIAMRSVQIMLHLIVAIRTRGYKFIFLDHYLLSNCNIMIQLTWFYLGNITKKNVQNLGTCPKFKLGNILWQNVPNPK